MKKQWPLALIKRGVRVGTNTKHPETIWWQETNPEAPTAQAARNIGYEAHVFVPMSYPERVACSAENLLRALRDGGPVPWPDSEEFKDLERVVDSFRDNVKSGVDV